MGKMFSSRIRRILAAFVILGAMTSSAFAPPLRMAPRVEPLYHPRLHETFDIAPLERRTLPDGLTVDTPDLDSHKDATPRLLRPSPRLVPID